jgi:hypothetical protein
MQQTFGKDFSNHAILTARPDGMDYNKYRQIRREQGNFIKRNLHH